MSIIRGAVQFQGQKWGERMIVSKLSDETGGFPLPRKGSGTCCLIVSQARPISLSFFCDLIITLGSGAFSTHHEAMARNRNESMMP
jgi:hypothetical protein